MDPELKSHLEAMEVRLRERIEQVETKLLSAFYDWARPVEIRLRTLPLIEERPAPSDHLVVAMPVEGVVTLALPEFDSHPYAGADC